MGDTGIKDADEAFKVGGEEGGYEELFKQVGLHPGRLNGLASTKKDARQKFVEEREEEGFETWKNFVKFTTSSSAKDHPQVLAFDYMKLGMNDLSNSLLNSGEDGVKVEDLKKISANEMKPKMVNAFMKEADNKPFIYQPRDDVYFFYDVFVERAARKWEKERKELEAMEELKKREEEEKERKELEAMEELKNQSWWQRLMSGRKGAGGGGRAEDLP
jgi:hypothetical protein